MGTKHNDKVIEQFSKNNSIEYRERKNNTDLIKTQTEIEELKKERNTEIKNAIDKINEKFKSSIDKKEKSLLAKLKLKEGKK